MRIDKEQLKQIILKEIKQNLSEQAQKKVYVKASHGKLRDGRTSGAKVGSRLVYGDELVVSAAVKGGFHKVIKHARDRKEIAHKGTWYVSTQYVATKLPSKADKLASAAAGTIPAVYPEDVAFTSGARG